MENPQAMPKSLWAATAAPPPEYEHPHGNIRVETLVVGAGYVGLSAALHLAANHHDVLVIDSAEPGWGASGRNGGQIISGLKVLPEALEDIFGRETGARMAVTMGSSSDHVYSLIDRYGIKCHDVRTGWIQAAHAQVAYDEILSHRFRQWNARGVESRLFDRAAAARMIGSSADLYCGAWFDPRGGVLQPLDWARGLARAVLDAEGRIGTQSPAIGMREQAGRVLVETPKAVIECDRVLLATNAYTDDFWPGLKQTVVPVSSFQVATAPLPPDVQRSIIPGGQGVTDTRRLLHYFRLDHTGRLVMGGRSPGKDMPTLEDGESLRSAIAKTFPQIADIPIEFAWSGRVAITKDSLPHVHMLSKNVFAALGCNGRGVANATMVGKLMADLATGTEPGDLAIPVTALNPFLFHHFRRLGVVAASTFYKLLDRLEARQARGA
jgi:glycine/D-amino acid oxidase-like deaminating enzyme